MRHSHLLSRIYSFLAYQCRVPLAPEHYPDLLALGALLAMWFALALGGEGGAEPLAAARAARLCGLALGAHLLVLSWRARKGFNFQGGALVFVPWLLWCVMDWAWFSPAPWEAEGRLVLNCMVFVVFWLALHHFRSPPLKWMVLAALAMGIAVGAALAIGLQVHPVSWLLSDDVGAAESHPLSATLGHPVAAGAVMLLVYFPCLGFAMGLRGNGIARVLAIPVSALLFAGLLCTGHLGVLAGLLAGTCIAAFLFTRRWLHRAALVVSAFFAVLLTGGLADSNTGIFREDPGAQAAAIAQTAANAGEKAAAARAAAQAAAARLTPYKTADDAAARLAAEPPPRGSAVPALVQFSWEAFADKPLQGQGAGGFRPFFETCRPAGWESTPGAPGGLPFALFVENGVLGAALFLAPALWVWCSVLTACLRLPRREKLEKTFGVSRRFSPVPEDRLYLAAFIAGSTGAAIALALDYPGPMPAVASLFALLGGAALRHVPNATAFPVSAGRLRERLLCAAAIVCAGAWLAWSRAPLKAAAHTRAAVRALAPLLPAQGNEFDPRAAAVVGEETLGRLAFAEENALEALRLTPCDAAAWDTLAATALRRFPVTPERGGVLSALALAASQRAIEIAPENFEFQLTHAHAQRMAGNSPAALRAFETAHALAPRNAATALALATALMWETGSVSQNARAAALLESACRLHPGNTALRARLNLLHTAVPSLARPITDYEITDPSTSNADKPASGFTPLPLSPLTLAPPQLPARQQPPISAADGWLPPPR